MAAINRARISDLDDIMITHRYKKSLETSPNDSGECFGWVESPSKALCVCLEDIPKRTTSPNGSWKQTFASIYEGR
jgi:hypothetical protein